MLTVNKLYKLYTLPNMTNHSVWLTAYSSLEQLKSGSDPGPFGYIPTQTVELKERELVLVLEREIQTLSFVMPPRTNYRILFPTGQVFWLASFGNDLELKLIEVE